eukprot:gene80-14132_t
MPGFGSVHITVHRGIGLPPDKTYLCRFGVVSEGNKEAADPKETEKAESKDLTWEATESFALTQPLGPSSSLRLE